MKQKISGFVLFLGLCFLGLSLMLSCSRQDEQAKTKKSEAVSDVSKVQVAGPVKIGAILPLTGPLGYLGEGEKNAIELAVDDLNRGHDTPVVQLVVEDSKGRASDAVSAANKLMSIDRVAAVLAVTTSVSRAVLPVVTGAGRILVALCMDPTIQKESPYAFRLYEGMDQEADVLLHFYEKSGKAKRVGMLYVNHAGTVQQLNDYFLPGFKRMGIKMVYQEPYELRESSFRDKISKLRGVGVDSLIIIGFGFKYFPIFKELSQQGLDGKIEIVGGWGFIAPNKVPASLLQGVVVACPQYLFSSNDKGRDFHDRYRKRYGKSPNFDDAFTYQAGAMITRALLKSQGDPRKAASDLAGSRQAGIMGDVRIDDDGALIVPMGLGVIHDGNVKPFKE